MAIGVEFIDFIMPIETIEAKHPGGWQQWLRYFHPHLFCHTLVALWQTMCQTPEQFKAWSQNLGHDGVMTTFTSYGSLSPQRQGELIAKMGVAR